MLMTKVRVKVLGTLAAAGALALSTTPAMAAAPSAPRPAPYTCTGGVIPSGSYSSLTVSGPCSVATGAQITVGGNVNVGAGAVLDAQSAPSTITVGGNVTALRGSFLGLGCQPPALTGNSAHVCADDPEGHSNISVGGNVTTTGAVAVLLNGITVGQNVTVSGGGSPEIPWSIKNNTIRGNITVTGQTTTWLGVMFNRVGQNVTLSNIKITDPDPGAPGVYIVRNTINGNLTCVGLTPGVSGGFVPGSVNVVGRNATGQCAALV